MGGTVLDAAKKHAFTQQVHGTVEIRHSEQPLDALQRLHRILQSTSSPFQDSRTIRLVGQVRFRNQMALDTTASSRGTGLTQTIDRLALRVHHIRVGF